MLHTVDEKGEAQLGMFCQELPADVLQGLVERFEWQVKGGFCLMGIKSVDLAGVSQNFRGNGMPPPAHGF